MSHTLKPEIVELLAKIASEVGTEDIARQMPEEMLLLLLKSIDETKSRPSCPVYKAVDELRLGAIQHIGLVSYKTEDAA